MFQSFEAPSAPPPVAERVAALRALLAKEGLAGYFVPHEDEYQGEYMPACAERLAWLTGFTGSAGAALVLADEAAVFVDGRYTLQVRDQTDLAVFHPEHLIETPPAAWLAARLSSGDRIGYDPRLITLAQMRRFEAACAEKGALFVPVEENPIDRLWTDRPAPPVAAVALHPLELAGRSAADKLAELAGALGARGADATVLTQTDSIAWAFNIRGGDVPHTPVALSSAILRREGKPTLFIDGRKLSNAVRAELADLAEIAEESALAAELEAIGRAGGRVLLDPQATPAAVARTLKEAGAALVEGADPVQMPRARKNAAELAGARAAHRRDGVAVTRFLAYLEKNAPTGTLDEIAAAQALERFRAEAGTEDGTPLADIAFDTISGAGPNGAIIHYRVTESTNRWIEPGMLYLVDSGAQYRDGTTDITRTVAIGAPTAEMRDRFTRVLKGHVAVATARFPRGTTGAQIDVLARRALWQAGLDFDHGTGHGVGAFLSVHEGPARISKAGTVPLEPGMLLSNEPGYYKAGAYGIRLENLVVVTEPEYLEGGERPMMGFETLTLAPFDRRLIEPSLLDPAERQWIDDYHRRVRETLLPRLVGADAAYLEQATKDLEH